MIIHELCKFYDILRDDPNANIPLQGYSVAKVSAVIIISKTGELVDIVSLLQEDKKGKLIVPSMMNVPYQEVRSKNVLPYFMCDNLKYVLGINISKDKDKKIEKKCCKKQFEAFKSLQKVILEQAEGYRAKAFTIFLDNYNLESDNLIINNNLEPLMADRNIVFKIDGEIEYLHNDEEIKSLWEIHCNKSTDDYTAQCMVSGQKSVISRVHKSLKNVKNAKSSGSSLVSFNANAYESYGKKQSYNAPLSKEAEFKYTTTLNYLLANNNYKEQIGDATTVFWAQSKDTTYNDVLKELFSPSKSEEGEVIVNDNKKTKEIGILLEKFKKGEILTNEVESIDFNTNFCILGLSPNKARVSVRFFYRNTFGELMNKILSHYNEMEIVKERKTDRCNIPIWQILRETVPPKSKDITPKPLLSGAIMKTILNGGMYPELLYQAIMQRIKVDSDIRVNYVRAALIKLCLLRKAKILKNKKIEEVLTVRLNEESKEVGYLLGRLFAVLEKLQLDSSGGVNSSIKNKYFTSACTTPKSVFPTLIRLSQHHIAKAKYGFVLEKKIEKIIDDIQAFPSHLSLENQGLFAIGYYHQKVNLYEKKIKNNETAEVV